MKAVYIPNNKKKNNSLKKTFLWVFKKIIKIESTKMPIGGLPGMMIKSTISVVIFGKKSVNFSSQ